jgi:ubiquitin C-terminal hydrolase
MIKTPKKSSQVVIVDPPKNYAHHNGILDRWTEPQIRLLQKTYQGSRVPEGLDFSGFLKVFPLLEKFPEQIRTVAFQAFTPSVDGLIGFREFCLTLSQILHANQDDQAAFLFRIFDIDLDRTLSTEEFQTLVTTCSPYLKSQSTLAPIQGRMNGDQFKVWAKANLSLGEALSCFEVVPGPDQERKVIEDSAKPLREIDPGTTVFLLSQKWWEAWVFYVRYDDSRHRTASIPPRSTSTLVGDRPVEIENESLIETTTLICGLKRGLKEGIDYVVLTDAAWEALLSWYGGGPTIKRTVILGPTGEKKADLYPPIVRASVQHRRQPKREPVNIVLGSGMTQAESQVAILTGLGLNESETLRFWLKIGSEWKQLHHFENPDLAGKEIVVEVGEFLNGRTYWPMDQSLAMETAWREFRNGSRVDVQRAPSLWVEAVVISSTNTHVKVKLTRENQYAEFPRNSDDLSAPGTKTPALVQVQSPVPPGAKGLLNLGNTCYINCILQCVSNTPLLREYLRDKKNHATHINTSNPNGFKGAMALEVANVIHDLWESRRPIISPSNFHKVLSRCFSQFQGHDQHDCHELLGVLLDSLHEDLSRGSGQQSTISLKNPEMGQENIQAEKQWKDLQGPHGSAISDLMGGQTKTTLICKECRDTTVIFELFLHIAVPIPVSMTQAFSFTLFPNSGRLVRYGVVLQKGSNVQTLATKIAELTGLGRDCFLLGDIYYNRLNSFYDPLSPETLRRQGINARTDLVAYETETSLAQYEREIARKAKPPVECEVGDRVDIQTDTNVWVSGTITNIKQASQSREAQVSYFDKEPVTVWIPLKSNSLTIYRNRSRLETDRLLRFHVLHRKVSEGSRPEMIGVPFIVTIGNWMTQQDLIDLITQKLVRFIRSPSKQSSVSPNFRPEDSKKSDSFKRPFTLKMLSKSGAFCYTCGSPCQGCGFPDSKATLANITSQNAFTVGVDWSFSCYTFDIAEDNSLRLALAEDAKNNAPFSLTDCINAFTKEEDLDSVCENCKRKTMCMKMDIWRIPDILGFSLKRFAYLSGAPEKIDQTVDYPLVGLDMAQWVRKLKPGIGLTQSTTILQNIYDLYAVVFHSGSMEGGHYTTCCLHEDEGKTRWLLYDDEQVLELIGDIQKTVVSRNAYLLFYRRRKLSSSNLVNLTCLS